MFANAKYRRISYKEETTQLNKTKLFLYWGEDQFRKFCNDNGMIIMKEDEISVREFFFAKKDRKQTVLTGKETLNN